MSWSSPEFPPQIVDHVGEYLRMELPDDKTRSLYYHVVNNWRASHAFPLNVFQNDLRTKLKRVTRNGLVAQRLKRLPAIVAKLRRFENMRLSQMQDIGGCRAVVRTIGNVDDLYGLYKRSRFKHERHNEKDYIRAPRPSGYRGIHLIYRYRSERNREYDGLRIEIQLRTRLQHAWATAVETVDVFTRQALKSSKGTRDWLRFFELASSRMAIEEATPLLMTTPQDPTVLLKELDDLEQSLSVMESLHSFRMALSVPSQRGLARADYYLLTLYSKEKRITIRSFGKRQLKDAQDAYLEEEEKISKSSGIDVVLVSTDTIKSLYYAYPNYFFNTELFIDFLRKVLKK